MWSACAGSCSAAGSSSLSDSKAGNFETRMREVTMGLQASQICQVKRLWHARLVGCFTQLWPQPFVSCM